MDGLDFTIIFKLFIRINNHRNNIIFLFCTFPTLIYIYRINNHEIWLSSIAISIQDFK